MAPTHEHLEAFAPVKWASQYLSSPDWDVQVRDRGIDPGTDVFNRETMRANDGVQHWLELYPKTQSNEKVTRTISLVKFGIGLLGFPGICHGGAILDIMDESLAYPMVVNETRSGDWHEALHARRVEALKAGTPFTKAFAGIYVTAKLDIQFFKPVLCPGVVGIETQLLEDNGRSMKMRAIMKDGDGNALLQADGVWVKIGGRSKL